MGGLTFLYPAFLVGALAVAIPLVLHLMRQRTDSIVEFPAVRLLRKTPLEERRRRRLRELVLLVLRVGALLLLSFAFARPFLRDTSLAASSPVTLVALDTSLSLSAPGQLGAAKAAARRAVTDTPPTHAVGLITFAESAAVVVPPSSDRGSVLAAIDQVATGVGATRYSVVFARAAELLGAGGGRVVVVTDLQQSGWDAIDPVSLAEGTGVEVLDVKPPPANLAIMAARRDGDKVVATLHNFSSRDAETTVRLEVDARQVATASAKMTPQASTEVRLGDVPAAGGAAVAIEDQEGYQTDNARYLVLDPPPPVPMTIVTGGSGTRAGGLYVQRALGAAPERLFQVTVVDGREFSAWPEAQAQAQAALVLVGTRTLERVGRSLVRNYLERGGQVLLTLGPDTDVATLPEMAGTEIGLSGPSIVRTASRATLVASDARHPIFRPFLGASGALGDIYVEQYRQLTEQPGRTVLARLTGGAPAFTEGAAGKGKLLVFASDLDNQWNRFPLNASFVPFMLETARYLTRGREVRTTYVLPDAPPGIPPQPGLARVMEATTGGAGGPGRQVAINVDVRESNPARMSAEQFLSSIPRVPASSPALTARADGRTEEERQRLWQIGLLVMLAALVGEGLLGRKAV